jgi:UDP-N-acetylmuramoylalanine--D-glutamate ligase
VPAAAEDSRFRVEGGQIYCSDEPLFPRGTLRPEADDDARALCVALAVLDGLGVDVPGARDDLREAVASFEPAAPATAPK